MGRRRTLALTAALFMVAVGGFLAGSALASSGASIARFGFLQASARTDVTAPASVGTPLGGADKTDPVLTQETLGQPASSQPASSSGQGNGFNPRLDKPTYWIDVDISDQRVRIMQGDQVAKEMIASTGVEGHETPLGTFEIQNRGTWFFNEKYRQGAKYWVSFKDWGVYLFHSLAMDKDQNVIEEEAAKLGQPASHGCVRLKTEDAKWIYDNIPERTKVVIHE